MHARLAPALPALLLLVACPDSEEKRDDRPPPHVLVDGATAVPLGVPLQVALPAGAAASSFAAEHVSLRGEVSWQSQDWPLDASLDAGTMVLTVTPRRALHRNTAYELRVEGLQGSSGAALGPVAVSFRTKLNGVARAYWPRVTPPEGWEVSEDGWRIEYERDAGTSFVQAVANYYSTGPDGRWLTADDPLAAWSDFEGVPPDGQVAITYHDAAGDDGLWRTPDDLPRSRTTAFYDAHGHSSGQLREYAGQDGVLDTGDDEVECEATREDAQGRTVAMGTCEAGPDGLWHTQDDVFGRTTAWLWGADGEIAEARDYEPGDDLVWGTVDDVVVWRTTYTRTPGRVTYRTHAPGLDGQVGTDDDELVMLEVDELDGLGNLLRDTIWLGPGPDHAWATGDDTVSMRYDYQLDASGDLVASRSVYAGEDGKLGGADDVVLDETEYERDR